MARFYFPNKLMVCLLPVLLVLIGYGAINQRSDPSAPDNSMVKAALYEEFNAIPVMPGAFTDDDIHFMEKDISMIIDCYYTTNSSYAEIKDFYDTQLKKIGWQFIGEEKVYDWFHDYGGKSIHYKKGNFTAELYYPGEKSDYSGTYSLSVGWKLEDAIKNEFALIPIMPNAKEEERNFNDTGYISMKAYYTTTSSDQVIKTYYDTQLRANGWTYNRTEGAAPSGQNLTGQTIVYHKNNNLAARLVFATGKNSPNRSYYFTISGAM